METFFAINSGIKGPKGILGRSSDGRGDTGFADSWRSVENHGGQAVGLHHAADDFSRSDQMFLTDDLVNGFWAHAKREIVRHSSPF